MNQKDTEVIGRVIRAELDGLRKEFRDELDNIALTRSYCAGPRGEAGEPGPPGEAGIPGEQGPVGLMGKDGRDGRDGKDGRDGADAFELPIAEGIDNAKTYPAGALASDQGALWRYNGAEWRCLVDSGGRLEISQDSERSWSIKQVFASGKAGPAVDFRVPALIYREIFDPTQEYEPGDVVTYNGSMWACIETTKATPGTKNSGWRLAVKRGLNGRSK